VSDTCLPAGRQQKLRKDMQPATKKLFKTFMQLLFSALLQVLDLHQAFVISRQRSEEINKREKKIKLLPKTAVLFTFV